MTPQDVRGLAAAVTPIDWMARLTAHMRAAEDPRHPPGTPITKGDDYYGGALDAHGSEMVRQATAHGYGAELGADSFDHACLSIWRRAIGGDSR